MEAKIDIWIGGQTKDITEISLKLHQI